MNTTSPSEVYRVPLIIRHWGSVYSMIIAAIILIASSMMIDGCAPGHNTAISRVTLATDTYTATLNTLTAYRRLGWIDDDQYNEIEKYRIVAAEALDAAEQAIGSDDEQYLIYLRAFNEAVQRLAMIRSQIESTQARNGAP